MVEKNQRGAKVENYRLSKEQLSFQKSFGRLKEVEQLLTQKQLMVQREVQSMQEMWRTLQEGYKALGIMAPKKPTIQFNDMNFQEEPEAPQGPQGAQGAGPSSPPMIEY